MNKKFNKDTPLAQVLESDSRYAQVLMGFGLHCFGCPLTTYETIEQAAAAHEIDLDFLLEKLNEDFDE
jgi:hybrid cluster-associated redox disulfide protein